VALAEQGSGGAGAAEGLSELVFEELLAWVDGNTADARLSEIVAVEVSECGQVKRPGFSAASAGADDGGRWAAAGNLSEDALGSVHLEAREAWSRERGQELSEKLQEGGRHLRALEGSEELLRGEVPERVLAGAGKDAVIGDEGRGGEPGVADEVLREELAEAGEEAHAFGKAGAPAAVVRRGLEEPDEAGEMLNERVFGLESIPSLMGLEELRRAVAELFLCEPLVDDAPGEQAQLSFLDRIEEVGCKLLRAFHELEEAARLGAGVGGANDK
jgi:hypothetical protein